MNEEVVAEKKRKSPPEGGWRREKFAAFHRCGKAESRKAAY